jgi:hypothetical protein
VLRLKTPHKVSPLRENTPSLSSYRSENTTFEENNLMQTVLHRPVELAPFIGLWLFRGRADSEKQNSSEVAAGILQFPLGSPLLINSLYQILHKRTMSATGTQNIAATSTRF